MYTLFLKSLVLSVSELSIPLKKLYDRTSHDRSSIVVIFLSHCFTFANTLIKLPYELQASSEVRDE